jgi:sec-independent protein translocase protein TatB
MFDISFSELLLIGVVALVVIGPERLPKVARTAGQWLGRLNRYVSQVKQDIDRDIKLEELRKMQQDMKDTAQRYEILANDSARQAEEAVAHETDLISKAIQPMSGTDAGLTMKELDKVKEEEVTAAPSAEPAALDTPAESVAPAVPAVTKPAAQSDAKAV